MTTTKPETKNKITPYIILITETILFYFGFGWLLGIWNPDYRNEDTGPHLVFVLLYYFGVFTFLFFAITLLPPLTGYSFILVTGIFLITATPCFFFSQALINTLNYNSIHYSQALKEEWNTIHLMFLAFIPQVLGFMLALTLRKAITNL